MEVNFSKFKDNLNFSILVNFPVALSSLKEGKDISFVCRDIEFEGDDVVSYLNKNNEFSDLKIKQVLEMVKLGRNCYTKLEKQKLKLAYILLHLPKVIVLEYFFSDLIFSEKEYFKRLFRNLIYKKNISIILIENDMNFIVETVKKIYLFNDKGKSSCLDDFYDDSIYKYVEMPYTVELIKYLESKGHSIDHDYTFLETLKAIYRGVS